MPIPLLILNRTNNMIRKVQLADQPLHRNKQLLNIHMDTLRADSHDGERRIPWLRNMAERQNVAVNGFELLAERVGGWRVQVGR